MKPQPASPLIARALEIAERKLGGEELARRLDAPDTALDAWRDGLATMPQHKFLLLVDVLAALDPTWEDWDRES